MLFILTSCVQTQDVYNEHIDYSFIKIGLVDIIRSLEKQDSQLELHLFTSLDILSVELSDKSIKNKIYCNQTMYCIDDKIVMGNLYQILIEFPLEEMVISNIDIIINGETQNVFFGRFILQTEKSILKSVSYLVSNNDIYKILLMIENALENEIKINDFLTNKKQYSHTLYFEPISISKKKIYPDDLKLYENIYFKVRDEYIHIENYIVISFIDNGIGKKYHAYYLWKEDLPMIIDLSKYKSLPRN